MAAVRVKQHVAQGQLEDNTAHRPDVARMGPACAKKKIKKRMRSSSADEI